MPRSSRSAPRPKPRAAPPRQQAPPPAAAAHQRAPPPAMPQQQQGGGGIMSGLMGAVAQGAALGTGSAFAHRAVDAVMGPRGGHEVAPAATAPEAQPAQMYPAGGMSAEERCAQQAKAFAECMSRAGGDMGACQFYFESMQACKRGDAYLS